jgi:hypothetical protein
MEKVGGLIMSNEWKDYQRNLRSDFEHNFESALEIPCGWIKSFIPQLKDEIFNALGAYADEIMFYQIKEKFGELVVYWNFPDKDYYTKKDYADIDELIPIVQNIVKKYNEISKSTCIVCGKAATHMTDWGWIAPLCDICEIPKITF